MKLLPSTVKVGKEIQQGLRIWMVEKHLLGIREGEGQCEVRLQQLLQGLTCWGEELEFYSKCNEKSIEGFYKRDWSEWIFLYDLSCLAEMGGRETRRRLLYESGRKVLLSGLKDSSEDGEGRWFWEISRTWRRAGEGSKREIRDDSWFTDLSKKRLLNEIGQKGQE